MAIKINKVNAMLFNLRLYNKTLMSGYYAIFKSYICCAFLVWPQNTNSVKILLLLQKITLKIMFFQNKNFQVGPLFRNYEILNCFDKTALQNCLFISKSLKASVFSSWFIFSSEAHSHDPCTWLPSSSYLAN